MMERNEKKREGEKGGVNWKRVWRGKKRRGGEEDAVRECMVQAFRRSVTVCEDDGGKRE